jgi:hypothetical protein
MDETENDSGTTSEPTDPTPSTTPELDSPEEAREENTDTPDPQDVDDDDVDDVEAPAKSRMGGGLVAGILALVLVLVAATVGVLLLKQDNGPYQLKGSITLGAIQQGQPCSGPIPGGGVTVAMIGSDGKSAGSALAGDLTPAGTNCTAPFAFEITKSDNYVMEIENPKDPSQSLPGPKYTLQELKDKDFNLVVDGNLFAPAAPPPTAPPGTQPAPPPPVENSPPPPKTPSSAPAS